MTTEYAQQRLRILIQKNKLHNEREILKQYLAAKFEAEDWHGVQDAASDLRDIDSELKGLGAHGHLEATPEPEQVQRKESKGRKRKDLRFRLGKSGKWAAEN